MNIGEEQKTERGRIKTNKNEPYFALILEESKLAQNCIPVKNKMEIYENCQVGGQSPGSTGLKKNLQCQYKLKLFYLRGLEKMTLTHSLNGFLPSPYFFCIL